MKRVIVLSRVSTEGQDLTQQTDEVLREVYKDGYADSNIILIKDKLSIIHRVVDIVTVENPNPTYSVIKIYNRINSLVYVYEVHCWRHTWTLIRESTSTKDPHTPIKCPNGLRKMIS